MDFACLSRATKNTTAASSRDSRGAPGIHIPSWTGWLRACLACRRSSLRQDHSDYPQTPSPPRRRTRKRETWLTQTAVSRILRSRPRHAARLHSRHNPKAPNPRASYPRQLYPNQPFDVFFEQEEHNVYLHTGGTKHIHPKLEFAKAMGLGVRGGPRRWPRHTTRC